MCSMQGRNDVGQRPAGKKRAKEASATTGSNGARWDPYCTVRRTMAAKFEVKTSTKTSPPRLARELLRGLAALTTLLAIVVFATKAHAAGSFKLKTTTVG